VILFAIAHPTTGLVRAVAAAMLVAQVPHFVYHAAHLGVLPTTRNRVLQTLALALTPVIPLLVLQSARAIRQERPSSSVLPTRTDASEAAKQAPRLVTSTP
jgi:hypothetical protein